MNRDELKNQIHLFRAQIENYRRAFSQVPNNQYGKEYAHYENMMNIYRSQLNQTYGKLEKYIDKVGGGALQAYLIAFGEERQAEEALSVVIQNLDRIIGRLEGMSDEEFRALLKTKQKWLAQTAGADEAPIRNPHRTYWAFLFRGVVRWVGENKIISMVLAGLIIAYLVYRFGWNK